MIDPVWALAHGDDPHLLPHHHSERSIAFYEALGLEKRRELPIRDEAMNYFLGVPGKEQPELELTYNFDVDSYELGTAYGHIALTIESMDETSPRSCVIRPMTDRLCSFTRKSRAGDVLEVALGKLELEPP